MNSSKFYDWIEGTLVDGKPKLIHYLAAVGVVLGAFALHFLLEPLIGPGFPLSLFYPALFLAAWFGGLFPGLLASFLSTLLACYLILRANEDRFIHSYPFPQLVIFLLSGCLFSVFMGLMHYVVAKRMKAHSDLAEQHEWFRVTLRSIGDAVMVTDRNGLIQYLNPEAERLSGWLAGEAKGRTLRTIFRIVNEETRSSVDDPVEKVFREKRVVGLANHTTLISKDGTEWPIEDSAAPVCNDSGDILGVVLVFHDATDLRRGQRAMKAQAEELERKVLERTLTLQRTVTDLESFSYTVSHDLRSPLRAMLGYASALLEDYAEELPKVAKDYLQRISRAAGRLDHLIQDLLTFSRLATEGATISPVDLNRVISEILQQYPEFHHDQADFLVPSPLPVVLGHESALTQVFSNLFANAVKFVPPGRKPKISVWAESLEHVVRIWIEDNGIGISRENFNRIFKIFEQINEPGTYAGTGVGLALVKKSVEKMQGAVGVESEEGVGSRFWVELIRVKQP